MDRSSVYRVLRNHDDDKLERCLIVGGRWEDERGGWVVVGYIEGSLTMWLADS